MLTMSTLTPCLRCITTSPHPYIPRKPHTTMKAFESAIVHIHHRSLYRCQPSNTSQETMTTCILASQVIHNYTRKQSEFYYFGIHVKVCCFLLKYRRSNDATYNTVMVFDSLYFCWPLRKLDATAVGGVFETA